MESEAANLGRLLQKAPSGALTPDGCSSASRMAAYVTGPRPRHAFAPRQAGFVAVTSWKAHIATRSGDSPADVQDRHHDDLVTFDWVGNRVRQSPRQHATNAFHDLAIPKRVVRQRRDGARDLVDELGTEAGSLRLVPLPRSRRGARPPAEPRHARTHNFRFSSAKTSSAGRPRSPFSNPRQPTLELHDVPLRHGMSSASGRGWPRARPSARGVLRR